MSDSKLTFARVAQMIRPKVGCRLIFVYDVMMEAEVMAERVPDPEFICTLGWRAGASSSTPMASPASRPEAGLRSTA